MTAKQATLIILVALVALAPLVFPSGFNYRVGALIFVNSIAVLGVVILTGYAGQASLGLPPALAVVPGAAISGVLAFLVGRRSCA